MTLHGYNALREADAVVYDALANPEILEWCRSDAHRIFRGQKGKAARLRRKAIFRLG